MFKLFITPDFILNFRSSLYGNCHESVISSFTSTLRFQFLEHPFISSWLTLIILTNLEKCLKVPHCFVFPARKVFEAISSCTHTCLYVDPDLSHNHTHSHTLQELTQCKSSARANHATSKAASFYIQSQSELVSAEERDCFTALLMSKSPSNSHTHITISRVSDSDVSLIPSALCPPPRASDWDMAVW